MVSVHSLLPLRQEQEAEGLGRGKSTIAVRKQREKGPRRRRRRRQEYIFPDNAPSDLSPARPDSVFDY